MNESTDGLSPALEPDLENVAVEQIAVPIECDGENVRFHTVAEAGPESEPMDFMAKEDTAPDVLEELKITVDQLVAEMAKHHQRASHREVVIDNLHDELEALRTGDRRSTIRPLLVAVSRLRDDLLRQVGGLPEDFDVVRARRLLESYADTIEITLEDYGVETYRPEVGDEFDGRRHRVVSSVPTSDPLLVRHVAQVKSDGYLDAEASLSLTKAEVVVFVELAESAAPIAAVPDNVETPAGLLVSEPAEPGEKLSVANESPQTDVPDPVPNN